LQKYCRHVCNNNKIINDMDEWLPRLTRWEGDTDAWLVSFMAGTLINHNMSLMLNFGFQVEIFYSLYWS